MELSEDLYVDNYDLRSEIYKKPGVLFTFQVLNMTNFSDPRPVPYINIALTIEGKYSVFYNYTVKHTDSQGYVTFILNRQLTDTDWGYKLPSTAAVELEIMAEFSGDEQYKPAKTKPVYTTHHPSYYSPPSPPPRKRNLNFLISVIIITTVIIWFIIHIVMYIHNKRYRFL